MRQFAIQDLREVGNPDASEVLQVSWVGTDRDKAISIAKSRMRDHWKQQPPKVGAVSVVDDEGKRHFTWTWLDQQSEYNQVTRTPYAIFERHTWNPETHPDGMKVDTKLRFLRTELEAAKSKAREIMIDAVKKGPETKISAVEVWNEIEESLVPEFEFTKQEAIVASRTSN